MRAQHHNGKYFTTDPHTSYNLSWTVLIHQYVRAI